MSDRFLPDPSLSFLEVLAARAEATPDEHAFAHVSVDGLDLVATPSSYREILLLARRAAALLASRDVEEGDRVLLAASDPALFLAFFAGAQALGAVPVPIPSRADFPRAKAWEERVSAIATSASPRLLVDEEPSDASPIDVLAAKLVLATEGEPPRFDVARAPGETAFLQYTSGSTGTPKGVVVTQANLAANLRAISLGAAMTAADGSVSWLPLYHDMGLVGGFLLGVWQHTPTHVLSPRTFVARPDAWLRAIDRFRATYTVAPNFAYHLVAKRLPDFAIEGLDLSCLRLAFDGAEPIDPSTAHAFTDRFARVGLRRGTFFPVYGLAECTLAAAFPEPGAETVVDHVDREVLASERRAVATAPDSPRAVSFVSVGAALPEHRIRIVDVATGREQPERGIGEIVIAGPSISPRYFGETETRDELRTGDLGYLARGRLFVVDRLKDLVIVGGRNYAPSDLERVACTVPGVKPGNVVAFGVRDGGTEGVVIVVASDSPDGDAIRTGVRGAIRERVGLQLREVLVVAKGEIPKTSSGKVQRSACKRIHEETRPGT